MHVTELMLSVCSMSSIIQFINCRQCVGGILVPSPLTIDSRSGRIISNSPIPPDTQLIDCNNGIIAPGYIELQTNGALGFHFAHFQGPDSYQKGVRRLAEYLPSTGVTGFYPTVPTVAPGVFKRVLPFLSLDYESLGVATVLGAHVEGPFLAPCKKGAHDAANMHTPASSSLDEIYGEENLRRSIRILTMAPELPGALPLIKTLTQDYGICVSMGHSAASHDHGLEGMKAGASLLTHTFNAMNPLHHREPGLVGKLSCYLSAKMKFVYESRTYISSIASLLFSDSR